MQGEKSVGFIAQDLDKLQIKHNIDKNLNIVLKTNPEKLEAAQGKLIPVLVKAIQDQQKHIENLEQRIDKLTTKE